MHALTFLPIGLSIAGLLAGMMIAMGVAAVRTREHRTARMSVNLPHGATVTAMGLTLPLASG